MFVITNQHRRIVPTTTKSAKFAKVLSLHYHQISLVRKDETVGT